MGFIENNYKLHLFISQGGKNVFIVFLLYSVNLYAILFWVWIRFHADFQAVNLVTIP